MSLTREEIIDGNIKGALGTKQEKQALEAVFNNLAEQMQLGREEFFRRVGFLKNINKNKCPDCNGTGRDRTSEGFLSKGKCPKCEGTGSTNAEVIAFATLDRKFREERAEKEAQERTERQAQVRRVLEAKHALRRKKPPLWARTQASLTPTADSLFRTMGIF